MGMALRKAPAPGWLTATKRIASRQHLWFLRPPTFLRLEGALRPPLRSTAPPCGPPSPPSRPWAPEDPLACPCRSAASSCWWPRAAPRRPGSPSSADRRDRTQSYPRIGAQDPCRLEPSVPVREAPPTVSSRVDRPCRPGTRRRFQGRDPRWSASPSPAWPGRLRAASRQRAPRQHLPGPPPTSHTPPGVPPWRRRTLHGAPGDRSTCAPWPSQS